MKLTFLGVGSAFTTPEYFQSNMLLTAASGKTLLIDCGTDIRHSLAEHRLAARNHGPAIDAVYISHSHSDHIGGLEYLAFTSYFSGAPEKIKLFAAAPLLTGLWEESLRGGLACIQGKSMRLHDYFDCREVGPNALFCWEGIAFQLVPMPHILVGNEVRYSYGLLIGQGDGDDYAAFLSTDSQFRRDLVSRLAGRVGAIFHDCETTAGKSGVHAHYEELRTLPAAIKSKMWLYHYHPAPPFAPEADGFKGFVKKGQEFHMRLPAAGDSV